jgi:hypothetical protein
MCPTHFAISTVDVGVAAGKTEFDLLFKILATTTPLVIIIVTNITATIIFFIILLSGKNLF